MEARAFGSYWQGGKRPAVNLNTFFTFSSASVLVRQSLSQLECARREEEKKETGTSENGIHLKTIFCQKVNGLTCESAPSTLPGPSQAAGTRVSIENLGVSLVCRHFVFCSS